MRYCLFLLFLIHYSSLVSCYVSEDHKPLGPVCRTNLSIPQDSIDPRRAHDHLEAVSEFFHTDLSRVEGMYGSYHRTKYKIAISNRLLHELKIIGVDAETMGYEDAVQQFQNVCLACCSCLPTRWVEWPSDAFVQLLQYSLHERVKDFSRMISVKERS